MRSRAVFGRFSSLVGALGIVLVGRFDRRRPVSPPRWKFKSGETLNYVLERSVDGQMKLAGNPIGIKMGMTFDTTWKCTGVE